MSTLTLPRRRPLPVPAHSHLRPLPAVRALRFPTHSQPRRTESTLSVFGEPRSRPGIAGGAYDTAWLASVAQPGTGHVSRFPTALQWLVEHQHPDGSWGGVIRYEHDRVLSTLAALPPLAAFGRRAADRNCVRRGVRYLWQYGHLLAGEPVELVGFELLLPALIERARAAGIPVPPHLDIYAEKSRHKLSLLSSTAIYSPTSTATHSLEFLGDSADPAGLRAAQAPNGSLGNSPAATAFFAMRGADARALAYLDACLAHGGGAMAPVLHPCERYELLWSAYHLWLAGVPVGALVSEEERAGLLGGLASGGVSLSESFPIADADDTAVALMLLHDDGEAVDARVLEQFRLADGTFASFPYERHGSVGVNVHVLHAAALLPAFPDRERTIIRLLDYLAAEQRGGLYWIDKWHISPYYATTHAIRVLDDVPSGFSQSAQTMAARAREWLRQTQNSDGSWGFYGCATAEETAYAVLALASEPDTQGKHDRQRSLAGLRWLARTDQAPLDATPLWIDKCLYTPPLVVEAVIAAARLTYGHRSSAASQRLLPAR